MAVKTVCVYYKITEDSHSQLPTILFTLFQHYWCFLSAFFNVFSYHFNHWCSISMTSSVLSRRISQHSAVTSSRYIKLMIIDEVKRFRCAWRKKILCATSSGTRNDRIRCSMVFCGLVRRKTALGNFINSTVYSMANTRITIVFRFVKLGVRSRKKRKSVLYWLCFCCIYFLVEHFSQELINRYSEFCHTMRI